MRGALILALAAGCTDTAPPPQLVCVGNPVTPWTEEVAFTALPPLVPHIAISAGDDTRYPGQHVALDFAWTDPSALDNTIEPPDGTHCPVANARFGATVDGMTGTIDPGGWVCVGIAQCGPPSVTFELADDFHSPDATLVFGDMAVPQTVDLGDAFVARDLTSPTWTFARASTITLGWSSSADLAQLPDTTIIVHYGSGMAAFVPLAAITRTASAIELALPAEAQGAGSVTVSLAGRRGMIDLTESVTKPITIL